MIHIFTLTFKGADKLKKLMPGLYENMESFDFVWHIRNNGNDPETKELVKSWNKDNIKLYEIGHNRDNFAQGMNYLFSESKPDNNDVLLLLNNDIIFVDEYSIRNMLNLMGKTDAGVVGAKLLYTGTNKLQHAGVIFGERYGRMPYHFRHGEVVDLSSQKNRYFQCVTAAVSLVKAEDFIKAGKFDQNLWWAFEDCALFININALRKNNVAYCGQTKIYHEESATLNKNGYNKLYLQKNVDYFKTNFLNKNKYILDHNLYLQDPDYNVIK